TTTIFMLHLHVRSGLASGVFYCDFAFDVARSLQASDRRSAEAFALHRNHSRGITAMGYSRSRMRSSTNSQPAAVSSRPTPSSRSEATDDARALCLTSLTTRS